MENKKLIAEALLEIAKNSSTTIIEVAEDKELIEAAQKIGIVLPSPDLAVLKTVYAEIDKVNRNGVVLPRNAVEKGLPTLIGKQINWEHEGSGRICGYTIDAKINDDKIEIIGVVFKSLFPEEMDLVKEKFADKKLAVSFEIWNRNPEDGKSVVHELENGFHAIDPIIFHGTGLLMTNQPACPKAFVYKLLAKKEIEEAEKIVDKIFSEDLIYAQMAIEEPKCKGCNPCTCEKDKEVIIVEEIKLEESKERLCPECKQPLKDEEKDLCSECLKKKEQSSETQAEVKPEETKTEEKSEVAETKPEEIKAEETKEEVIVEEKKEEATTITVTQEKTTVDEIKPEGEIISTVEKIETLTVNDEGKEVQKVETEIKTVVTYTLVEMEQKVQEAKVELQKIVEEKDKEITQLKQELGTKDQEIADLKNPKVEEKKEKEMTVGAVEGEKESELKRQAKNVNDIIATRNK